MLDGDLAVGGEEGGGRFEELRVEREVVGRIGVDEVEGAGLQAGEAGGEGQAADLEEALAQLAGVRLQGLHRPQVLVHGQGGERSPSQRLQPHDATAREEVEDARALDAVVPDREERLAHPPLGRPRARRHGEPAAAELAAGDPDARLHRSPDGSLDTSAMNFFLNWSLAM